MFLALETSIAQVKVTVWMSTVKQVERSLVRAVLLFFTKATAPRGISTIDDTRVYRLEMVSPSWM